MATPQVTSQDPYIAYASRFFHDLTASGGTTPQQTPQATTIKKSSGVSFDDFVSITQSSKTLDEAVQNIGLKGQDFVLDGFKEDLKKEIQEATKKAPTTTSSDEQGGFFSSIFKWMGESKAGKALGFGVEAATDSVATTTGAVKATATTASSTVQAVSEATSTVSNVIGGLYGAFDLISNFGSLSPAHGALSGLTVGASIGSFIPGVGTAIGGLVGAAVGGLMSLFKKSGKDKDQKARDQMRAGLQQAGIIDEKFTIGLADGTRYDIGIDGKPKKEFNNLHPFDVDMNNPLAVKIATFFAPLTLVACGGNKKLASDLTGYLTNASLSNAGGDETKARTNVQAIYGQFKIKPEALLQGLGQLTQAGAISPDLANGYVSVLKEVFK